MSKYLYILIHTHTIPFLKTGRSYRDIVLHFDLTYLNIFHGKKHRVTPFFLRVALFSFE